MPYDTTDSGTEIVRGVAAHEGRANAIVWLGLVAMLTLVPAVLWVGRVVGRTAPKLTAAAMLLPVPAYLMLALLVASDGIALYGVQHDLPTRTVADMYTAVHPIMLVGAVFFVLGHVLGTVLLGLAMLRGRAVPRWAAIATLIAQPLHFVAAIIVANHPLDFVAWSLNAVGFAAVSLVILRTADDDWAPHPVGATR